MGNDFKTYRVAAEFKTRASTYFCYSPGRIPYNRVAATATANATANATATSTTATVIGKPER